VTSRTLKGEIRAYLYVDLTSIGFVVVERLKRPAAIRFNPLTL
jgi:hypothetical protein